jgi:hypothetical protein
VRSEVNPLRRSGTLIALHGFGDRGLKVDRSLIDPIMKLKADYRKIQEYLHIRQYDLMIDTSHIHLTMFTLLTPIERLPDT